MPRHEEYMSERYSNLEMNEMRADMKKTLELIYKEHGNVNIEVSYFELDTQKNKLRRDTMWLLSELLNSFDGEHDLLYFSDLEAPEQHCPLWTICYDSVWENENIEFEQENL